jgi:hypothetical protein
MLEIILNYVYECLGEKSPGVPYLLKRKIRMNSFNMDENMSYVTTVYIQDNGILVREVDRFFYRPSPAMAKFPKM